MFLCCYRRPPGFRCQHSSQTHNFRILHWSQWRPEWAVSKTQSNYSNQNFNLDQIISTIKYDWDKCQNRGSILGNFPGTFKYGSAPQGHNCHIIWLPTLRAGKVRRSPQWLSSAALALISAGQSSSISSSVATTETLHLKHNKVQRH